MTERVHELDDEWSDDFIATSDESEYTTDDYDSDKYENYSSEADDTSQQSEEPIKKKKKKIQSAKLMSSNSESEVEAVDLSDSVKKKRKLRLESDSDEEGTKDVCTCGNQTNSQDTSTSLAEDCLSCKSSTNDVSAVDSRPNLRGQSAAKRRTREKLSILRELRSLPYEERKKRMLEIQKEKEDTDVSFESEVEVTEGEIRDSDVGFIVSDHEEVENDCLSDLDKLKELLRAPHTSSHTNTQKERQKKFRRVIFEDSEEEFVPSQADDEDDEITKFLKLVSEKEFTKVERLLKNDSKKTLLTCDKQHRTALHVAVQQGHCRLTEILINHGADIDFPDKSHKTPLAIAALRKLPQCLKILLDIGDIAKTDRILKKHYANANLLHLVVNKPESDDSSRKSSINQVRCLELFKRSIRSYQSMMVSANDDGDTPVMHALKDGQAEVSYSLFMVLYCTFVIGAFCFISINLLLLFYM